jgi:integrase
MEPQTGVGYRVGVWINRKEAHTMSRRAAGRRQPVVRRGQRITSLWQRKTKNGDVRYDVQLRLENGGASFKVLEARSVDAAIAEAAQIRLEGPPAPTPTIAGSTVEEVADALIADMHSGRFRMRSGKSYRVSTSELYELELRMHIVEKLGKATPWRSLTRVDIDGLVDEVAGTRAANSARNTIGVLRTLDRFASRRLGTVRLTLELEGVPVARRLREPVLVSSDVVAKVPERHRVAAALCRLGGTRASEACAIEWRHVQGTDLVVEQQLDGEGGMTSPKSSNSTRRVPIVPKLRAELDAHEARIREGQDELARRRPLEGRVYAYDRHVLRRALKRALDICPQDLRHSWKEQLREAGVNEVDSARLAGHSPQVGSTHYASADSAERARELVLKAFA